MEPFVGQIIETPYNFAPLGWAFCDGSLLAISENDALFALIGTTYGGDGQTTFALPDLRGRMAIHVGQGPGLPFYSLGERAGAATTTLSVNNIPPHNHPIQASSADGTQSNPSGAFPANANVVPERGADPVGVDAYATSANGTMAPGVVGNSGGGQAFNNMPPYLAVNYIIALFGIFPSRS
ncbi:Microcystin-dependent protein [Aquiflexum balticum DSM 16537]|uniref:Microcystin-dependent protein n=1 Tax=Aquiflexum balticum DSM 16537 TaxID=758820 RepID=A0A1W2H9I7_9BACT|nr:tail fiber protein [Aquiflexum balticum]SMD45537.1 Microcystin-dependent protein [Aquiflexum balticum DSM 16537]